MSSHIHMEFHVKKDMTRTIANTRKEIFVGIPIFITATRKKMLL
jgi:hypothetical protein